MFFPTGSHSFPILHLLLRHSRNHKAACQPSVVDLPPVHAVTPGPHDWRTDSSPLTRDSGSGNFSPTDCGPGAGTQSPPTMKEEPRSGSDSG